MSGSLEAPLTETQGRRYRFGLFELDTHTGDLYRDGLAHPRLQGQPLELLLLLLERPGELVTREELRKRLWSSDTFVDYDHGLNAAVNKLRETLGDSADSPRFIQTLPRRGYRFIAPVQAPPQGTAPAPTDTDPPAGQAPLKTNSGRTLLLSDSRELPPLPSETVRVLFSMIQVLYLGMYVSALVDLKRTDRMLAAAFGASLWIFVLLIVTALVGIVVRLYLFSAAFLRYRALADKFRRFFVAIFVLDELWALAPLIIAPWIGMGLALAAAPVLVYLPFSQRSLLLMPERSARSGAPES
jgi:DNA-binding winged helix-turn-helix (wHTH) protein